MFYGLLENFYIKFLRNSQQTFAYIISFNLSGDSRRDVNPNQFQIDSRYRSRLSKYIGLCFYKIF